MASEILKRDQNSAVVLGGVTDNAAQEIRMLRVDPTTNRLLVSATGGGSSGTLFAEVPIGTIDGVNTVFTLSHTPLQYSYILNYQGQIQLPADFTIVGTTLTYTIAPFPGTNHYINYQY